MSSSGVISEPPPTPVSPTRMPTPSPNRMMTGSTVRSEGGWRASAASRTPRATRRSRDGREDRAPVRWARSGWAERQRVALGRSAVPFAGGPADPDAIRAAIRGGAAGPAPRHPRVEPAVRTPRPATGGMGMEARRRDARVAAMVATHGEALRRVARRFSANAEDAEDAVQRGLEIYVRRLALVDPATELAWLKVVVRHEALAVA